MELILTGLRNICMRLVNSGLIQSLSAQIVQLDVSNPNSIASLKHTVGDIPIDILFNVAGTWRILPNHC